MSHSGHNNSISNFSRVVAAQYSEQTVGPLNSATCFPMFMQFTGCDQPVQRFYWPENAIDCMAEIMLMTYVIRTNKIYFGWPYCSLPIYCGSSLKKNK